MPKINVLPKSVAELIAAGEVVERPSSAVKELIENSIDAKATAITVEIKNGGVKYIRITDNGCGIEKNDVRTAFISHATSKIQSAADLDSVFTLGFRGEALPSIAAVSRLCMLTKSADEQTGTMFNIEGGEETSFDDAGCPTGTTITVKDLFYNTPARMKFLKRDITEGNYIADIVAKTAIAHPDIRFTFIKEGKLILTTPGSGDLYSAVYAVYGKEVCEGLIPCSYKGDGITVNGFVSKPLNNRSNRNMQHFYVNGRYVRLPVAAPALDEAYKNSIMIGKFPMCFIFIDINATKIDVNVHPAKTEIRFSEDTKVFESIYFAAKSAINKGDFVRPEIKLQQKDVMLPPKEVHEQTKMDIPVVRAVNQKLSVAEDVPVAQKPFIQKTQIDENAQQYKAVNNAPSVSVHPEKTISVPAQNQNNVIKNGGFVLNDTSSVISGNHSANVEVSSATGYSLPWSKKPDIDIKCDEPSDEPSNNQAKKTALPNNNGSTEEAAVITSEQSQKNDAPVQFSIIGEIFKTYILVESGSKLLIIDKHAAHERMIFNRITNNRGNTYSQLLLSPVTVRLSGREYACVLENLDVFIKAGYLVEDFGEGSLIVRECPVELEQEDISAIITEIAGELLRGAQRPEPEKLSWLLHSTACRAAVKAGDSLKPQEMYMFVEALLNDNSIRYCPHGRPVMYELSKHEIEKQFGRLG